MITGISFGGAGTGKSTINNTLLTGNPNSNEFIAGETSNWGLTQNVAVKSGLLFGKGPKQIELIDLPGTGDYELNIQTFINEMTSMLKSRHIDFVMLTIKSNDVRFDAQQLMSLEQAQNLIENLNCKNLYLVITNCDLKMPSKQFVQERLQKYSQYNITIPEENVVFFEKNVQSLHNFAQKLTNSAENMKFASDPDKAMNQVMTQVGSIMKTDFDPKQQVEFMTGIKELLKNNQKMMLGVMQSQFDSSDKRHSETMATMQQMMENILNRPPQERIIEKEKSGGCNIF